MRVVWWGEGGLGWGGVVGVRGVLECVLNLEDANIGAMHVLTGPDVLTALHAVGLDDVLTQKGYMTLIEQLAWSCFLWELAFSKFEIQLVLMKSKIQSDQGGMR